MNHKKFKKLLSNPKLFLKDMYIKRSMQLKKHLPMKYSGTHHYTIVSAVYNVEKYLDDYFNSIVKQSLDFKKHIQIILVDDGSTDHSAQIIKKWQSKFPNNIHYFYKENGGQASARNLGLEYVQTEWVTFIDPDDFISPDYFYKIDKFIGQNTHFSIICCPLKFYFEDQQIIKDTHPLKYRFANGNSQCTLANLKNHLQLSASTAFFKIEHIKNHHVLFDKDMKPSFEDAKFVTDYILSCQQNSHAGFIADVSYFYRKRSDGSSTLDSAWQNPLLFSRVIEKGCIEILKTAQQKFGTIPEHIQRITLYHIIWYFGRIVNNPAALSHLTTEQQDEFVSLLHQMFEYIDDNTILRFNLAGVWWFQKVALLGLFKHKRPTSQIAYVEDYDLKKQQILIKYFSYFPELEYWEMDGQEIFPVYHKQRRHNFVGQTYVNEYKIWLQCRPDAHLKLSLNDTKVPLTFLGRQFDVLPISQVQQHFMQNSTIQNQAWIFIDREDQADDNAEHLYEYIQKNHAHHELYFALKQSSPDWERLNQKGFNLLDFGSADFENKLKTCAKIISSHIDGYITHYFQDDSLLDKDYVFLQHGITKDDLSNWLNGKKIALFVTASHDEYHSIVDNGTSYKFGSKEVKLTGFPRYDKLIAQNQPNSKQILIMPTWRSGISGTAIKGTEREKNPDFMQTNYAKHWHGLLNHHSLYELHQKGYKIIFAPHPNIKQYMDEFTVPDFIQIYNYSDYGIQQLFQAASMLITDYSSVAFDIAYLNKPIIYYQFDHEDVFSGAHTYQKGYFDYERDGFGDIAHTESELLIKLNQLIHGNDDNLKIYQERGNKTFAFRDNFNCERVYQAIMNLDKPDTVNPLPIIERMIEQAETHKAWHLAASRIHHLLSEYQLDDATQSAYQQRYCHALFQDKQLNNLQNYLNKCPINRDYWQAKIHLEIGDAVSGAAFFAQNSAMGTPHDHCRALLAAAYHQDEKSFAALFARLEQKLAEEHQMILMIAQKLHQQLYFETLDLIDVALNKLSQDDKGSLKLELLAAYICMNLVKLSDAHQYLVRFETHSRNDPSCRVAIARLAKLKGDGEKLFNQLNRAFEENLLMIPEDLLANYLNELSKSGNTQAEAYWRAQFRQKYPKNAALILHEAKKWYVARDWEKVLEYLSHIENSPQAEYLSTLAALRSGKNKQVHHQFEQDSFQYWKLAAELAELNDDKALLKECLRQQLNMLE